MSTACTEALPTPAAPTDKLSARPNAAKLIAEKFGVSERSVYRSALFANAVERVAKVCGHDARTVILSGKSQCKWSHKYTLAVLAAKHDDDVRSLYEAAAAGKRFDASSHMRTKADPQMERVRQGLMQAMKYAATWDQFADIAAALIVAIRKAQQQEAAG